MRTVIVLESLEGRRLLSHSGPSWGPDLAAPPPPPHDAGEFLPFDRSWGAVAFDHGGPGHDVFVFAVVPGPWRDAPPGPDGSVHPARLDNSRPSNGGDANIGAQPQTQAASPSAKPNNVGVGDSPTGVSAPALFGTSPTNASAIVVARANDAGPLLAVVPPASPLTSRSQPITAVGTGHVAMVDLAMAQGTLVVQGRPEARSDAWTRRDASTAGPAVWPAIGADPRRDVEPVAEAGESVVEGQAPAEAAVVPDPQLADLLTRFLPSGLVAHDGAIADLFGGLDDALPSWPSPIRLAVASVAMAVSAVASGAVLRERRTRVDAMEARGGLVLFPGLPGYRGGRPS